MGNDKFILVDNELYLKIDNNGNYQRICLTDEVKYFDIDKYNAVGIDPNFLAEFLIKNKRAALSSLKLGDKFTYNNRQYILVEVEFKLDFMRDTVYRCYDFGKQKIKIIKKNVIVKPSW